ncbi:MAG: hypothetical protein HY300_18520 [Verrucomicrobia bacterium]|nr:hypothetical protein [Verrucomicrobiota bacterium]
MKPRLVTVHGRPRWLVESYIGSKRRRFFFGTKAAAERKAAQLISDRAGFGRVWLELDPRERAEVCAVLAEMRERSVTARAVWEAFKRGAVKVVASVRVPAALDELEKEKRTENLRPNYITDLLRCCRQFTRGREAAFVSEFSTQDVRDFVAAGKTPGTRATRLGRLESFFSLCLARGWVAVNPFGRNEAQ